MEQIFIGPKWWESDISITDFNESNENAYQKQFTPSKLHKWKINKGDYIIREKYRQAEDIRKFKRKILKFLFMLSLFISCVFIYNIVSIISFL